MLRSFITNEVTKVYAAYKIFTNEILVACKIDIHNSDLQALSCTCLLHVDGLIKFNLT